jgi:hypothetical protein
MAYKKKERIERPEGKPTRNEDLKPKIKTYVVPRGKACVLFVDTMESRDIGKIPRRVKITVMEQFKDETFERYKKTNRNPSWEK